MKSIYILFISLFLFPIFVNGQSIQEDPIASTTVVGYLKIGTIEGEAKTSGFESQIEIYGLSLLNKQGATAQAGRGRSRARAQVSPISIVKKIDSASPYLMLANMQGKSFPDMTITLMRPKRGAEQSYFIIRLENVTVYSYQLDSSSNRQEIISLSAEEITVKYIASDGDEHEITFDIAAGV